MGVLVSSPSPIVHDTVELKKKMLLKSLKDFDGLVMSHLKKQLQFWKTLWVSVWVHDMTGTAV